MLFVLFIFFIFFIIIDPFFIFYCLFSSFFLLVFDFILIPFFLLSIFSILFIPDRRRQRHLTTRNVVKEDGSATTMPSEMDLME